MNKTIKYASVCILAAFLIAGVLYADGRYRNARTVDYEAQLQLLVTLRQSALETYFNTARAEISFWSVSDRIQESMQEIITGWEALGRDGGAQVKRLYNKANIPATTRLADLDNAGDGSAYSDAHARLHNFAREFVTGRGYYDFFLIDMDGDIVYTVEKEADFGTNLFDGPYKDSGLGDVFRRAIKAQTTDEIALSDFARYAPSYDAPAIFAGKLVHDTEGKPLGVLALQLPSSAIAEIMRFTAGMGESGETYLVGTDLLMRSDSRFSERSTIMDTKVETETVRRALEGQSGVSFTPDYRGIRVLSAYDYIDLDDTRWAVMAEIDADEVNASIGNIRSSLAAVAIAIFTLLLVTFGALRDFVLPESEATPDTDLDIG
jgi:methyl-accepting chemotaxis protein